MELLGEYPNDVEFIELERLDTSEVLWRVVADNRFVQIHQLFVCCWRERMGASVVEGMRLGGFLAP